MRIFALRPLVGELDRETRLAQLARERPLARDVEVPDELLRDRRAALDDLALADVGPERARDADRVDAAVLPVALVLDRDRRLRHPRADLAPGHPLPVPSFGGDRSEARAVGGVDERVLPDREGLERGERAALVVRDRAAHADAEQGDRDDHAEGGDEDPDPAPALAALLPLRAQPPRAEHGELELVAPAPRRRGLTRTRRRRAAAGAPARAARVPGGRRHRDGVGSRIVTTAVFSPSELT